MRLINVKSLRMKEFFDKDIPEYVILSHTWDCEEVTFQDWQTVTALEDLEAAEGTQGFVPGSYAAQQQRNATSVKAKAGYRKTIDFCREVADRGFEWAWIDTCCIDKTSSAELSEAINSMFRWYQDSCICLVYLSDVLPGQSLPQQNTSFRNSRWFTRGWTLQELLAPDKLYFFNSVWAYLGDKTGLEDLLADATGISQDTLDHFGWNPTWARTRSVSERMSWASKRTTTRAEDMAYCLLGIFNVNMPLLYGEGGVRAFTRLQEEIMKNSTDHSILAWGYAMDLANNDSEVASAHSPSDLLASSPADFVNGADIIPVDGKRGEPPIHMTNRGLQIRLKFRGIINHPGQYIALLNCCHEIPFDHIPRKLAWIGLHVQLLHPDDPHSETNEAELRDGDVVQKFATSLPVAVTDDLSEGLVERTVFIKKYRDGRADRVGNHQRIMLQLHNPPGFENVPWNLQLVHVFPPPLQIDLDDITSRQGEQAPRKQSFGLHIWKLLLPSDIEGTDSTCTELVIHLNGPAETLLSARIRTTTYFRLVDWEVVFWDCRGTLPAALLHRFINDGLWRPRLCLGVPGSSPVTSWVPLKTLRHGEDSAQDLDPFLRHVVVKEEFSPPQTLWIVVNSE